MSTTRIPKVEWANADVPSSSGGVVSSEATRDYRLMVWIRPATRADAAVVAVLHQQARSAYYRVAGYEPDSSDRFAMWDRYIT